MSLTNIYEAFDVNKRINPAYTGALFTAVTRDEGNGTATSGTEFTYEVPQDGNGNVDLQALETWANGRVVGLLQIYGQYGQHNLQWNNDDSLTNYTWTNNQFITLYDGTNFVVDANNLLILNNRSWWYFQTSNNFTPATFSVFMRLKTDTSKTQYMRGLFASKSDDGDGDAVLKSEQGSTGSPTSGYGSPSYYKDGASISLPTKDDVYNAFVTGEYVNIGITNLTNPHIDAPLNFLRGRTGFEWEGDPATILIYDADVSADVDSINTLINAVNENFTTISGEITLSGVAIPDAIVNIMRATNPFDQSTHELVETVIADGNGVYTATLDTDTLYDYWASPVGFVSEFTGTITSVGGTGNVELTLPSDLSGLNIGGANNDLYVIKATGGAGSGNAVAVTGRTGNTITVAVNPGFTDTTVYDLGKAYFPGKLFSKTETA
jgi:hypothetical protein